MGYSTNTLYGTSWRGGGAGIGNNPSFTGVLQGGDVSAGAANYIGWLARSRMRSGADGVISLLNNAETGFTRLQFGGIGSTFPAIAVSGTGLAIQAADGSLNRSLTAQGFTSAGGQFTSGGSAVDFSVNGNITLLNNAQTGFTRLQFGGTSSSFPSLKRNGGQIDIRVADDTGYTSVSGSQWISNSAAGTVGANQIAYGGSVAATASAGAGGALPITVDGYIIINVAGTTKKIGYYNI